MDRKRKRSSSGWRSFSASSRTLRLKCSQDSSRLKNRLGPNEATPALASSGCSCSGKVMNNLVNFAFSCRLSAPRARMLPWQLYHLRYGDGQAPRSERGPVDCRNHHRGSSKRPLDAEREKIEHLRIDRKLTVREMLEHHGLEQGVIRGADTHRRQRIQPRPEVGERAIEAAWRISCGEQHEQPLLARKVEEMEQRLLVISRLIDILDDEG